MVLLASHLQRILWLDPSGHHPPDQGGDHLSGQTRQHHGLVDQVDHHVYLGHDLHLVGVGGGPHKTTTTSKCLLSAVSPVVLAAVRDQGYCPGCPEPTTILLPWASNKAITELVSALTSLVLTSNMQVPESISQDEPLNEEYQSELSSLMEELKISREIQGIVWFAIRENRHLSSSQLSPPVKCPDCNHLVRKRFLDSHSRTCMSKSRDKKTVTRKRKYDSMKKYPFNMEASLKLPRLDLSKFAFNDLNSSYSLSDADLDEWEPSKLQDKVAPAKTDSKDFTTGVTYRCTACDSVMGDRETVRNHILLVHLRGEDYRQICEKFEESGDTLSCIACQRVIEDGLMMLEHDCINFKSTFSEFIQVLHTRPGNQNNPSGPRDGVPDISTTRKNKVESECSHDHEEDSNFSRSVGPAADQSDLPPDDLSEDDDEPAADASEILKSAEPTVRSQKIQHQRNLDGKCHLCGLLEKKRYRLYKHYALCHYKEKIIGEIGHSSKTCHMCAEGFATRTKLIAHLGASHDYVERYLPAENHIKRMKNTQFVKLATEPRGNPKDSTDIVHAQASASLLQQPTEAKEPVVLKCKLCSFSASNKNCFVQHLCFAHFKNEILESIENIMVCTICGKEAKDQRQMMQHYGFSHGLAMQLYDEKIPEKDAEKLPNPCLTCQLCDKTFVKGSALHAHYTFHHFRNQIVGQIKNWKSCDLCGYTSSKKRCMQLHHGRKHGLLDQLLADELNSRGTTKVEKKAVSMKKGVLHKKEATNVIPHQEEKSFNCKLCSFSGSTSTGFARHLTFAHFKTEILKEIEDFCKCAICDKKLETRKLMINHYGVKHGFAMKLYQQTSDSEGDYKKPNPLSSCKLCDFTGKAGTITPHYSRAHFKEEISSQIVDNEVCTVCGYKAKSEMAMILHYGRAHDWIDKLLAERLKPKSSRETSTAVAGSGIMQRNESGKYVCFCKEYSSASRTSLYRHYTFHYKEELLEHVAGKAACTFCSKPFTGNLNKNIQHVGVTHNVVDDYLAPGYRVSKLNLKSKEELAPSKVKEEYKAKVEDANVEKLESDKAIYECYICKEGLTGCRSSDYIHYATKHFKDQLSELIEDRSVCPFCDKQFTNHKLDSLKHVGIVHSKLEDFLPAKYHIEKQLKNKTVKDEENAFERNIPYEDQEDRSCDEHKLSSGLTCHICKKSGFRNRSILYAHYSLTHFRKKLLAKLNGSKRCPVCQKSHHLKMKFNIMHLGASHSFVDKYLPSQYQVKKKGKGSSSPWTILTDRQKSIREKGLDTLPSPAQETTRKEKPTKSGNLPSLQCCLCEMKYQTRSDIYTHYTCKHFMGKMTEEFGSGLECNFCKKKCRDLSSKFIHIGVTHSYVDKYLPPENIIPKKHSKLGEHEFSTNPVYIDYDEEEIMENGEMILPNYIKDETPMVALDPVVIDEIKTENKVGADTEMTDRTNESPINDVDELLYDSNEGSDLNEHDEYVDDSVNNHDESIEVVDNLEAFEMSANEVLGHKIAQEPLKSPTQISPFIKEEKHMNTETDLSEFEGKNTKITATAQIFDKSYESDECDQCLDTPDVKPTEAADDSIKSILDALNYSSGASDCEDDAISNKDKMLLRVEEQKKEYPCDKIGPADDNLKESQPATVDRKDTPRSVDHTYSNRSLNIPTKITISGIRSLSTEENENETAGKALASSSQSSSDIGRQSEENRVELDDGTETIDATVDMQANVAGLVTPVSTTFLSENEMPESCDNDEDSPEELIEPNDASNEERAEGEMFENILTSMAETENNVRQVSPVGSSPDQPKPNVNSLTTDCDAVTIKTEPEEPISCQAQLSSANKKMIIEILAGSDDESDDDVMQIFNYAEVKEEAPEVTGEKAEEIGATSDTEKCSASKSDRSEGSLESEGAAVVASESHSAPPSERESVDVRKNCFMSDSESDSEIDSE